MSAPAPRYPSLSPLRHLLHRADRGHNGGMDERTYSRGPWRGLTPSVIRLGLVSLFADISSEMLYPLTPIFLAVVLGAPMGVIGFIEGVAEATASLLRAVSGRLSDRTGRRRPFVVVGYTLSAFAKPLIALAAGWPLVLVARVADRFGKGLRTSPRDALLADSVDAAVRGRAFGWHRAMDTTGAVIGPLLALALLAVWGGDLRPIFLVAFIPGLIGAALVFTVREHRRPPVEVQAPALALHALPPAFQRYLLAWGVFAVANSSDIFLILKAKGLGYAEGTIILLYTFYNVLYAVASPGLGQLSDRWGRKVVLLSGLAVFALVYLGFAAARQPWQVWPLFAIYGLYTAATDGVGKALAVDLTPASARAGALGLLGTVTGLATLLASSLAGLLWQFIAPWAAFAYGALGALAGALLLLRVPGGRPDEASAGT